MYNLFIATPEEVLFDGDVITLTAPGTLGFFEILTNHAPITSTLKAGQLRVTDKDNVEHIWELTSGFLECNKNKVTLLADKAKLLS